MQRTKSVGKTQFWRRSRRWNDDIKMDIYVVPSGLDSAGLGWGPSADSCESDVEL